MAGIDIISDSKREEINRRNPAIKKIKPPSRSFFHATMVRKIKMKLGIRCISKAKNHCGWAKTSRANELIKAINKIAKMRGSQ